MESPLTLDHNSPRCTLKGRLAVTRRWWRWLRNGLLMVLPLLIVTATAGAAGTNPPAEVKISGFGFLGNREMLRLLRNAQSDGQMPVLINGGFIEDASLMLFSRARRGGYLDARLRAAFTMPDGSRQDVVWTNALDVVLPLDFAAKSVRFRVLGGVRYYYESLEFVGLTALKETEVRNYFVTGDALLKLHRNRIFSPDLLKDSITALTEALLRKGYRDAVVMTNLVQMDKDSGAVNVKIEVVEGLPTMVRSVEVTVKGNESDSGTNHWTLRPRKKPYSILWEHSQSLELREQQYAKGYPDTAVQIDVLGTQTNENSIQMDVAAQVDTGERVHIAGIEYKGNKRTRTSVLESRVRLEDGQLLDRNEAEESRQRLARLGVFRSVNLEYEDVDVTNRNVTFDLKEVKPISLSVLAGYGSYELLRGGLEFENRNVMGFAHDLSLRAVQSFKSTSFDGQYTVPEVFGRDLNAYVKGSALRRKEVTFTREEYGGSAGVQKYVEPIKTTFGVYYSYQFLDASSLGGAITNDVGVADARSAAFVVDFNRDRRSTPVLPRTGTRLFGRVEFAAADLGGNVNYQRLVLGGSYHLDLHGGRLLHLGLVHGDTLTLGGNSKDLPFTKRFFPGGENSVRGYQDGEASPLDSNGDQLGAETYTQGNIELEQLITKSWSVVVFLDAVGFAQDRNDYPWDEELYSAGGGVSWRSPIGPVRLEYGYNLDPRRHDPAGTLHFSIGFPF